jgi:hypothetical protein
VPGIFLKKVPKAFMAPTVLAEASGLRGALIVAGAYGQPKLRRKLSAAYLETCWPE